LELLAAGRMAEVFAWDDGRVLKLDRAEWNGCGAHEAEVLARVAAAGVRAPRVDGTATVDARFGVVMERVDGPLLSHVLAAGGDVDALARELAGLHTALNAHAVEGLPDLMTSLADGIGGSGLDAALVTELRELAQDLDDGRRALCHFDLHPENVIVAAGGWVVIDWLSASTGPPLADFARTLLLMAASTDDAMRRFTTTVLETGLAQRAAERDEVAAWVRVLAAARIGEGFTGEYAAFLARLAAGTTALG
jgi:aminoglycoside phosphotransferase (APT) family kinase protein